MTNISSVSWQTSIHSWFSKR